VRISYRRSEVQEVKQQEIMETSKINEQEVRRSGGSIRYKKNSLSPNLL
jgi:hypothetical protein